MEHETIITLLFFLFLIVFLYFKRKKIAIQKIVYPVLYLFLLRTKLGLKSMDAAAKRWPRALKVISYTGIVTGFLGMAIIAYELIWNFVKMLITPSAPAGVAAVLPFKVKGAIYVPILFWILSIFIIALVHEFSHGVIARLYNIPIKSSGFAFFCLIIPIFPAAFVEPDEKKLEKKKTHEQLGMFAAGPFSNIILAFICLALLVYMFAPVSAGIEYQDGVSITGVSEGTPAAIAGLQIDERIIEISGMKVTNISDFIESLEDTKPGDTIEIITFDENIDDEKSYNPTLTENPQNESKAYVGLQVMQSQGMRPEVKDKYGWFLPRAFLWIQDLFFWLFFLNLGIGLFNLAPLSILDGGRMVYVLLLRKFKEDRAKMIFKYVSLIFLALILIPVLYGFIR